MKKLKILIVEDEETSDTYLSIVVKEISKEIFHAKNGMEAVAYCQKNPDLDLILMDIKMPEMSGYKATKLIRAFNKEVVIIAQTAFAFPNDRKKALAAGCTDYISKPFHKNELLKMIDKYLKLDYPQSIF